METFPVLKSQKTVLRKMEAKEIELKDMSKVDVKVIKENDNTEYNDAQDPIDMKITVPEPPVEPNDEEEKDGTMTSTAVLQSSLSYP